MAKPVISAAKFSAYRKARRLYCDLLRRDVAITERVQEAESAERKLAKPISDAIRAVQGKAKARIMCSTSLIIQVREFEERLGIPKKSMDGMREAQAAATLDDARKNPFGVTIEDLPMPETKA